MVTSEYFKTQKITKLKIEMKNLNHLNEKKNIYTIKAFPRTRLKHSKHQFEKFISPFKSMMYV